MCGDNDDNNRDRHLEFSYDDDDLLVHQILFLVRCYPDGAHNPGKAKPTFISVMKKIPPEKKSTAGRIFVGLCGNAGRGPRYVDCAEAMLKGETGHDVDVNFLSPVGFTALHLVASFGRCREMVELLFRYGANADIRGVDADDDVFSYKDEYGPYGTGSAGLLPIETALYCTRQCEEQMDPYRWTSDSEETMINLLDLLCGQDEFLKIIGLLACKTKEIEQVIHRCVREAEVTNLAILLLVVRQKVLSLTILEGKEASASEGGLKIRECIMTEIATLTEEEHRSMSKDDSYILSQNLEHKKKKLMFSLLLLEVFEKAGDAFDRYLQSKHENGTSEDVAGLLKDAGCNLQESMENIQAKREKFKEHKCQSTVPQMSLCSQTDSLYKTKQEQTTGMQYQQRMSIWTCVPHACAAKVTSSARQFGFEFPMAGKALLMKTTRGIEHRKTGFVSNNQWLSFAFSLKRFIRRA